jgi:hypothetical protein
VTFENELEQQLYRAGIRFGTDKVTVHGYQRAYSRHLGYLSSLKNPRILELGIGDENRALGGASLKMWKEVFPGANVIGVDKYDKRELDADGISTVMGDVSDRAFLRQLQKEYGPFHLIIDDASHMASDSLCAMFELLPATVTGGYYVIEDTYTSYWPSYGGSAIANGYVDTPTRWAKLAIDMVHRAAVQPGLLQSMRTGWNLASVACYPGLCFFEIGDVRVLRELDETGFISMQAARDVEMHEHLMHATTRAFESPADALAAIYVELGQSPSQIGGEVRSELTTRLVLSTLERIDELRAQTKVEQAARAENASALLQVTSTTVTKLDDVLTACNVIVDEARATLKQISELRVATSMLAVDIKSEVTTSSTNLSDRVLGELAESESRIIRQTAQQQLTDLRDQLIELSRAQESKIAKYQMLVSSLMQARGWRAFVRFNGFSETDFYI